MAAAIRALGKLQVAMLVSLVLFIVGVPATGKYQRVCKVVLEIGYRRHSYCLEFFIGEN